jgi:hypothetical protein
MVSLSWVSRQMYKVSGLLAAFVRMAFQALVVLVK